MIKILAVIATALVLILCIPFATIWMINTFGEYLWPGRVLPYSLDTWAAAAILGALFTSNYTSKKKD